MEYIFVYKMGGVQLQHQFRLLTVSSTSETVSSHYSRVSRNHEHANEHDGW